jgi:hypothetical protein
MPSPLGHVIAGMTAGWLVAGAPSVAQKFLQQQKFWGKVAGTFLGKVPATLGREAALFGALGALPDIDLLFGAHSGPTHSIGAAALVGLTAFAIASGLRAARPGRLAVACAAAYGSHVLLDWLGRDSSPPIGIMALWPVSRGYFESALHVFMPISRRYHQGWVFVRQNGIALVAEIAILGPLLALTVLLRSRASST